MNVILKPTPVAQRAISWCYRHVSIEYTYQLECRSPLQAMFLGSTQRHECGHSVQWDQGSNVAGQSGAGVQIRVEQQLGPEMPRNKTLEEGEEHLDLCQRQREPT